MGKVNYVFLIIIRFGNFDKAFAVLERKQQKEKKENFTIPKTKTFFSIFLFIIYS